MPDQRGDQAEEKILGYGCQRGRSQRLPEIETLGEAIPVSDEIGCDPAYQDGDEIGNQQGHNLEALQQDKTTATPASSPLKDIFFDFDRYDLRADAREILKANADWLKKNPATRIEIEGHCDERGTVEYNLALGEKRAKSAMSYLTTLGVPQDRLSVISYGKEKPADPGHDEAAWAKNRRAEFVVIK